MTDRELLEAAAKAMGEKVPPRFFENGTACLLSGQHWNPLADHGDAALLAMSLRMRLDVTDNYVSAEVEELAPQHFAEPINGNTCRAWCRAIVRAAAAMAA